MDTPSEQPRPSSSHDQPTIVQTQAGRAAGRVVLIVALTANGFLLSTLLSPQVLLHTASNLASLVVVPGLLGIALAVPLRRVRKVRRLGGALTLLGLMVAILLPLSWSHLPEKNDVAMVWQTKILVGVAMSLLTMSPVLFTTWMGRALGEPFHGLKWFAFLFLGAITGSLAYPLLIEPTLTRAEQLRWGTLIFAGTEVLFAGALILSSYSMGHDSPTTSAPPTWLCRIRWMLLGGLPGCVDFGATSFIASEISPIPLVWLAPLVFSQFTWLVAFARTPARSTNLASLLGQILGALVIALAAGMLLHFSLPLRDSISIVTVLGLLLAAALMPHRATLPAQIGLTALVLIQGEYSLESVDRFGLYANVALPLLACVVISWGCHGDALADLSSVDRLPEFMLCTQFGAMACGIVYQTLSPLVMPASWGLFEYPIVLVACLMIRLRRESHGRSKAE